MCGFRDFVFCFRIPSIILTVLLIFCLIEPSISQIEELSPSSLPTVTVRGFLNFKTTVDGTVIVFTPASEAAPPATDPQPDRTSEVLKASALSADALFPKDDIHAGVQDVAYASPPQNSLGPLKTHISNVDHIEKVKDTFLHHIAENAVLPSTGQVNNDLDRITRKIQPSQNQYPTGLVTVLGGTHVDGQSTTVFETKVIGTYIDGKYAQILQSTSHIIAPPPISATAHPVKYSTIDRGQNKKSEQLLNSKINPASDQTMGGHSSSSNVEISPTVSSSRDHVQSSNFDVNTSQQLNSLIPSTTPGNNAAPLKPLKENDHKSSQPTLQSSFATSEATLKTEADRPTQSLESAKKSSFMKTMSSFVPKTSTVRRLPDDYNTVATSNKNLRNSTSRIRFLSPRRPSQSVRLNRFKVKLTLRQDSTDEYNVTMPTDDDELDEDHASKDDEEIEVVTDNIGMAVDPARVVFQETTITSEVTLHVGRRKSIRTLTITTSVPLTVNPTDIQDLLSSDGTEIMSDATGVDSNQHIVTRTYTTTERALKTSVVPIYDGKSTAFHTVTESFFIMKIITAYRTLPPGDASILESLIEDPNDPEPGTLEVAANIQPSIIQSAPTETEKPLATLPPEEPVKPSIALPAKGNIQHQLTNPLLSLGHALSNNPLAAVYLGLQQLNAQMTLYSTVTDTSSYVTTETLYNTRTIRFYDGRSTRFRMISEPTSTRTRTVTTTTTSIQPYLNTHALQQQQQLQKLIAATQLNPPQPQFSTVTSTYTTVTTATSLSTRIYTLIYNGFSTKFRTVTSTTLHPTTVTITSTSKVPIAATQVNLPFAYPYSA